MNIVFESAPEGTTHFLRYASGYIVWCKLDEGQNNQLILSEWDSGNEYWVPGIFPVEHYQKIGLTSINDLPTQNDVDLDAAAPKGATHRYQHGGETSWYRETEDGLFVWRDGSWYASTQKNAKDLAKVCPFGAVTAIPSYPQPADDIEEDLTWLAKNVHKWDKRATHVHIGEKCPMWTYEPRWKVSEGWFTRDQWLARRAELQNKPSWEDVDPEFSFIAQSPNGHWEAFMSKPHACDWWISKGTKSIALDSTIKGAILGDWRDTLERRPVDLSEPVVTARLTEATENVLAAAPALMDEKFRFDRGDWFERGELPPVNSKVMHKSIIPKQEWSKVDVIAHAERYGLKVAIFECGEKVTYSSAEYFRPIRTERELAIEEMCQIAGLDGLMFGLVAGKLYDAGYRKEPK